MDDLTGIAAVITALSALFVNVYVVYRLHMVDKSGKTLEHKVDDVHQAAKEIHDLTNSNFSQMQRLLSESIATNKESAKRDRERMAAEDAKSQGSC